MFIKFKEKYTEKSNENSNEKRKEKKIDANWRLTIRVGDKKQIQNHKEFFSSEINNNKWMNEFISQQMEKQTENWIEQTIVIDLYNNYS